MTDLSAIHIHPYLRLQNMLRHIAAITVQYTRLEYKNKSCKNLKVNNSLYNILTMNEESLIWIVFLLRLLWCRERRL